MDAIFLKYYKASACRMTLLFFVLFQTGCLFAETAGDSAVTQKSPIISIYHSKLGTGDHLMKASLNYRSEEGIQHLMGKKVIFAGGEGLNTEFGESITNDQGTATFTVPGDKLPAVDSAGSLVLGAKFEGDKEYESVEDQVITRDLIIEVTPNESDSVRTITAKVYSLGPQGEKIPLIATDIFFYLPRMFSYLKIGEGTLDSTGTATIEFPVGLPGDSEGILTVIARVEDHDIYGNVEGQAKVKWGSPTQPYIKRSYRALWSQVAPTWMVITLIILLVGVWGHYTFAVIKLFQIKKEAQKLHIESSKPDNN